VEVSDGVMMWLIAAPSGDGDDVSVTTPSLSVVAGRRPLDTSTSDISLTNDTSSYIGSMISR